MSPPYLRPCGEGVVISVRVQPNARKHEIVGPHGGDLKIKIKAPPVEGKANAALIEFLAEVLAVSKSAIEIVRGNSSRNKHILVRGPTLETVDLRLTPPTCR